MANNHTQGKTPGNGVQDVSQAVTRQPIRQVTDPEAVNTLTNLIRQLEAAQIHFELARYRDDSVSIRATVPGERWEIDVLDDGTIDFERFVSTATIGDETDLAAFIQQYSEHPTATIESDS